ncbi:MAG: hypothetical protein JWO63_1737 [Frankiales bacterium]|nr:hypothetical protein [Frankiales bacterium]
MPLWLPDPLPRGWSLAGLGAVGDLRSRFRATVTAFAGPAPLGGDGEWLLVAEEPAIGLGAGYALSSVVDFAGPTEELARAGPPARVHALGHPTPLWPAHSRRPDRSAYVGEAEGVWLWLIGFPADAGYAVLENLVLIDARDGLPSDLPRVAPSARMRPAKPGD